MKKYMRQITEYRGFIIKSNHKTGYLDIYDVSGNYLSRVHNFNHGSITDAKAKIDLIIPKMK
ncbi:hypothetical protein [Hungatella hathewayi]|uniref:hypothetical protein n=1 Tax=Hungatella hathewayi TaxID=154046 RepID=UPI003564CC14